MASEPNLHKPRGRRRVCRRATVGGIPGDPASRRAHISFATLDSNDKVNYLDNTLDVSSLTFDPTGKHWAAGLGAKSGVPHPDRTGTYLR
jgi:hypothetical protein